jgi:hypothetical protein
MPGVQFEADGPHWRVGVPLVEDRRAVVDAHATRP